MQGAAPHALLVGKKRGGAGSLRDVGGVVEETKKKKDKDRWKHYLYFNHGNGLSGAAGQARYKEIRRYLNRIKRDEDKRRRWNAKVTSLFAREYAKKLPRSTRVVPPPASLTLEEFSAKDLQKQEDDKVMDDVLNMVFV